MTRARPARAAAATAAAAALVAALLVLVTWAAAVGPDDLVRGDGPAGEPRQAQVTDPPEPTDAPTSLGTDQRDLLPDAPERGSTLGVVVLTLGVLALLAAAALALRWLVRRARAWLEEREPSEPDPEDVDLEVLSPQRAAAAAARDAQDARARLEVGTPRNAIVECWARFEATAARAGVRREEWETPAEVVVRFFDHLDADGRAVQRLATLYREARFSDHEIGEDGRRAAAEALEAVTRSLQQVPS